MCPQHLVKWDAPAHAIIKPEPHNFSRLLFLPGLRPRTVLFFAREILRLSLQDEGVGAESR